MWRLTGADWPNVPKAPDADPNDFQGHGTHVAGIVAGKSQWYTGVAPEATLLAYKVFSEVCALKLPLKCIFLTLCRTLAQTRIR